MNLFDIAYIQPRAWSLLARSFTTGRAASTYLIYGREGLGDWPLALTFAALLNCREPKPDAEQPQVVYPCGECASCRSIQAVNFEGLHIVVPVKSHKNLGEAIDLTNEVLEYKREHPFGLLDKSQAINLPIDMAREVKRRLAVKGAAGVTRLALFYRMDLMRTQAADALLKLIEEPPSDTVIIMTTGRLEQLPQTIQSRSQRIKLERVAENTLVEYLMDAYEASEKRAKLAAKLSDGVPGRAIEMLAADEEASEYRAVALMLFKSVYTDSGPETVSRLTELISPNDRGQAEVVLRLWQSLMRDCAWYASAGTEDELVNVDFVAEITRISKQFAEASTVRRMVDHIKNTLADMARNVHIQTALVALVLKLKSEVRASATQEV